MNIEHNQPKINRWVNETAQIFSYPNSEKYPNQLRELDPERLVERMHLLQKRLGSSTRYSMMFSSLTAAGILLVMSGQVPDLTWRDAIPCLGSMTTLGMTFTYVEQVTQSKLDYVRNEIQHRLLN